MREPLPLATGASHEYAERRARGSTVEEAREAAAQEWAGRFGDGQDRHLAYVHGPSPEFARLLAAPSDSGEGTRFGELARRLWAPLLACEAVGAP